MASLARALKPAPRDGTARARPGGHADGGRRRPAPRPIHATRPAARSRGARTSTPTPSPPLAPRRVSAPALMSRGGAGGGARPHGTYGTIAAGEVPSEEMWGGDGAGGDARESPRVAGGACHRPAKVPRAVSHKSDPAQSGLAVWREGSRRTVSGWARGAGRASARADGRPGGHPGLQRGDPAPSTFYFTTHQT